MRTTNNKKNPSVCFRSWIEITFTVKFNVFVTHTNFASAAAVSAANFQLSREWMPQQYNIQLTNLYSFTSPLFSIIDCLCSAITERVLTKKNAILNAIEKWQNTRETFTGAEERFGCFFCNLLARYFIHLTFALAISLLVLFALSLFQHFFRSVSFGLISMALLLPFSCVAHSGLVLCLNECIEFQIRLLL